MTPDRGLDSTRSVPPSARTQLGAYAEAKADEYRAKAGQARLAIIRRWYERREAIAREIARDEIG